MIFLRNYFFNTTQGLDLISVVHEINRTVRESGIRDGLVTAIAPDAGAALVIVEPLAGVLEKLRETVLAYASGGFETKNRRKEQLDVGPIIAAAILGRSLGIPLKDGRLVLGCREEPILIDFTKDGRRRELCVWLIGEGGEAKPGGKIPPQMQKGAAR